MIDMLQQQLMNLCLVCGFFVVVIAATCGLVCLALLAYDWVVAQFSVYLGRDGRAYVMTLLRRWKRMRRHRGLDD